ncbi:hypothetical protein V8G54_022814 [Vigna mungo]|uniref:Uncharacterized protein n=1 Tax=Vigna mungo TaxID=3915 RepID=A0AAQ3N441_VIGMU
MVQEIAHQALWCGGAAACDPSTVKSRRLSLLCETSLTLCPPVQEPRNPSLRKDSIAQLLTWSGQAALCNFHTNLVKPKPCSITMMPPLGSQADVTQLGERTCL